VAIDTGLALLFAPRMTPGRLPVLLVKIHGRDAVAAPTKLGVVLLELAPVTLQ
jgi:hypothetical protein